MVNNEAQLRLVADLIAAQFGPSTEVVLHDFGGDIDHHRVHRQRTCDRTPHRRRTDPGLSQIYEAPGNHSG